MAVICFASLKGGVGKTTLSINAANAFAERGCETLLIDLDPAEHASRHFQSQNGYVPHSEAPLARLFLGGDLENRNGDLGSMVEAAVASCVPLVTSVRPHFALLPGGTELRHFLWGKGARAFKLLFPRLLEELSCSYDYIIIDTPPDHNVLTRNSIAAANLVVVPVDASAMSIHCLEDLVMHCDHIKGPVWSILRTMVNRQASRVRRLSDERLRDNLVLRSNAESLDEESGCVEANIEDPDTFISMITGQEEQTSAGDPAQAEGSTGSAESPIFLLNSVVYRTEQQNRLTFSGRTAFDTRSTAKLADQYLAVAKELEQVLSCTAEAESMDYVGDFMSANVQEEVPYREPIVGVIIHPVSPYFL